MRRRQKTLSFQSRRGKRKLKTAGNTRPYIKRFVRSEVSKNKVDLCIVSHRATMPSEIIRSKVDVCQSKMARLRRYVRTRGQSRNDLINHRTGGVDERLATYNGQEGNGQEGRAAQYTETVSEKKRRCAHRLLNRQKANHARLR